MHSEDLRQTYRLIGLTFTLDIDIVPDHFTGHDLILSSELSDLAEVRIRKRQATLSKLKNNEKMTTDREDGNANWTEVLCINVDDEDEEAKNKVSLHHILNPDIKQRAKEMIEDYHSMRTRDSGVKMRLMLKDEIPVHQNLRRLLVE